ncbi:MAG: hypothetical protein ACXWFC_09945 [Nitrososphaeraceae archaeon]
MINPRMIDIAITIPAVTTITNVRYSKKGRIISTGLKEGCSILSHISIKMRT